MRCLKSLSWLVAAGAVLGWMTVATEAKAAGPIQAGDHVAVTAGGARLMLGRDTLARVGGGQELQVIQVKGPWVGTSVTVGGKTVAGWVWNGRVTRQPATVAQSGGRRAYSYQPGPYVGSSSGSSRRLIMGDTPYGRRYWRAERKVLDY